jgi:hypothetical protein
MILQLLILVAAVAFPIIIVVVLWLNIIGKIFKK